MIRNVLLAAVFLGLSTTAGAATSSTNLIGPTLSSSQGTVLVNDGSHFVTARPGQILKPGDRVMVMQGGTATLTYADGSKAAVPSGSLYSVNSVPQAGLPVKKIGRMYAQAVGDTDDRKKCRDKDGHPEACAAVEAPGDNNYVVAAGAVGVVLIAAAIASSGGSDNHHQGISQP